MQNSAIEDISELVLAWAQLTNQSPRDVVPAYFHETINLPLGSKTLKEWQLESCHDADHLDWMPYHVEERDACKYVYYLNTNRTSPRHPHLLVIQYWYGNGPIIKQEFGGDVGGRIQIDEHIILAGWIQTDDLMVYHGADNRTYQCRAISPGILMSV